MPQPRSSMWKRRVRGRWPRMRFLVCPGAEPAAEPAAEGSGWTAEGGWAWPGAAAEGEPARGSWR